MSIQGCRNQGRIQDFKLGRGGAKIFGVFRVKNHDFMQKNHIFSNFRGGVCRVHPPWIRPWELGVTREAILLCKSKYNIIKTTMATE